MSNNDPVKGCAVLLFRFTDLFGTVGCRHCSLQLIMAPAHQKQQSLSGCDSCSANGSIVASVVGAMRKSALALETAVSSASFPLGVFKCVAMDNQQLCTI